MKKKFILGIVIFTSLSIFLLFLINHENYEGNFEDNGNFTLEYSIELIPLEDDPYYDQIKYTIKVTNNTDHKMTNLNANIKFDNEMGKFISSTLFSTYSVDLMPKSQTDLRNDSVSYNRTTNLIKPSTMSQEEIEKLHEIFHKLQLELKWRGGSETIHLTKDDAFQLPNFQG